MPTGCIFVDTSVSPPLPAKRRRQQNRSGLDPDELDPDRDITRPTNRKPASPLGLCRLRVRYFMGSSTQNVVLLRGYYVNLRLRKLVFTVV